MQHTAIVTGANQGIGAATARALAAQGVQVLITFLRYSPAPDPGVPAEYFSARESGAESVVEAIAEAGGRAHAVEVDLTDGNAPASLFDTAERLFGPVDVLVNNASGWVQDTFLAHGTDQFGRIQRAVVPQTFDAQFAVDARAGALLIAEFARRHLARGGNWGRIVGLTSGSPDGFPGEVSYGAAKAALNSYTMSAAAELWSHGVTANMVKPGVTDTGWVSESVRGQFPVALPEEVASVVAFLCSDAGGRVTGNILSLR
ncbi:SDR family NAD(P)-dependent oxidoreductase [Actinosynnema sp. NPDC047251]|uniref:Short-chain dehydrogenase/reductase n=1 Tax=Saccharothrix espanaensis (strain ATCC 51144 / DSM 44229 / JCM 9112 / NBRC 15066 / NRRL 15764) TaxID=1179773 RepID=K0K9L5_SACES|nr:SDR family NAD(P)-dependent oxidoreductase [Saccharothrix espanaensis]CCH34227.1 Short-chain dehydrogenase/reductase [Saccharothrix espanaensis DSM 44229]